MSETTDATEAMIQSLLITETPDAPEAEAPQDDPAPEVDAAPEAQEVEAQAEGDDPEAEDTNEADDDEGAKPEASAKYTVKVDGKEVAVTLDELKRSFSGQAYIQKGMQEAAEQRKQAEALFQTLQAEQEKFLSAYQQIAERGFKAPPQAPDPKLLDADPIGYMQARARYETDMQEFQAQQSQIQHIAAQRKQLQEKALAEYVAEQSKILQQRIPEMADPVKGKEIAAKIRATASEAYGFTDDELGGVTDARHVQVLHDAMKWRELQKAKALQKQAPNAPKVVKPVARRPEPEQLARSRQLQAARKVGKPDAFVDLLLLR